MGLYEVIVKTEEIRKKAHEGDYINAQKIMATMDLKKVKHVSDILLMAEVYTQNAGYEEAFEQLLRVYNKSRTRKILSKLVENAIDRENVRDAQDYLEEYIEFAPEDFYQYIYQYQIGRLNGDPIETLIEPLYKLKSVEYMERWAYELAKLYYKADMEKECLRECSDIILWFGEGVYVEKAKLLRAYYSGETGKDKIMEEIKKRAKIQEHIRPEEYTESEVYVPSEEYAVSKSADSEQEIEIYQNEQEEDYEETVRLSVGKILDEEQSNEEQFSDESFDEEQAEEEDIEEVPVRKKKRGRRK